MVDNFWLRPDPFGDQRELPYTQPALTQTMLEHTESLIGVTLPREYVALLKRLNGGIPRRDSFWLPQPNPIFGTHTKQIKYLLGIPERARPAGWQFGTVADAQTAWDGWGLPKELIPFTKCESDYEDICLDYRRCAINGQPSVVCTAFNPWQYPGYPAPGEVVGNGDIFVLPIAASFEAFIQGLFYGAREHGYGVIGGGDPRFLVDSLERATGLEISPLKAGMWETCAFHPGQPCFGSEVPRWDNWQYWSQTKSERRKHPAQLCVAMNMGFDSHRDFPDHPECEWVIWANIAAHHRAELESQLNCLAFPVVPLHVPDLKRMYPG